MCALGCVLQCAATARCRCARRESRGKAPKAAAASKRPSAPKGGAAAQKVIAKRDLVAQPEEVGGSDSFTWRSWSAPAAKRKLAKRAAGCSARGLSAGGWSKVAAWLLGDDQTPSGKRTSNLCWQVLRARAEVTKRRERELAAGAGQRGWQAWLRRAPLSAQASTSKTHTTKVSIGTVGLWPLEGGSWELAASQLRLAGAAPLREARCAEVAAVGTLGSDT